MVFMMVRDPGILFVIHRLESIRNPRVFEVIASKTSNTCQVCSVCGHLGHKACGKSKPQKDKLFESSFVIPGVFFGVSVSETILERFCRFSNFKLWGNDFPIASGLPG